LTVAIPGDTLVKTVMNNKWGELCQVAMVIVFSRR